MFDVGFWEILVIAVVALLVVGPDEFPALVRKVTQGISKARQFATAVKTEFHREVEKAEELKRMVEQETRIAEMHKMLDPRQMELPVDHDARRPSQHVTTDAAAAPAPPAVEEAQAPAAPSATHSEHGPTQKS